MNDTIRGAALDGQLLWMADQLGDVWIGSGLNQPGLVRSPSLAAALQFYLSQYPETDVLQAVLGGQYRMSMPSQAATSIIDAVMKELQPEPAIHEAGA